MTTETIFFVNVFEGYDYGISNVNKLSLDKHFFEMATKLQKKAESRNIGDNEKEEKLSVISCSRGPKLVYKNFTYTIDKSSNSKIFWRCSKRASKYLYFSTNLSPNLYFL